MDLKDFKATSDRVKLFAEASETIVSAMTEELTKLQLGKGLLKNKAIAQDIESMVDSTPADISARYWLMQFLEPLSRKELKAFIDGFLVQLLTAEQAKKLVKFLLVRYPTYFTEQLTANPEMADLATPPAPVAPVAEAKKV
jgi:hypothetical protein